MYIISSPSYVTAHAETLSTKDLFVLTYHKNNAIVKHSDPYLYVGDILGVKQEIYGPNKNYTIEYRWSFDNQTFSDWLSYDELVETVNDNKKTFWAEYRVTFLGNPGEKLWIKSIQLVTSLSQESEKLCKCAHPSFSPPRMPARPFIPIGRNYTQKIEDIQKNLSYIVNYMYGTEVKYMKIDSNKDYYDVLLKEYLEFFSNKEYPSKCLRVMIPEGQIGDGQLSYSPYGVDFDSNLEIHIDLNYFQSFYGENEIPQRRDIVFIPLLNRVYEVHSTTPVRNLMGNIIYYKASLSKWSPRPTSTNLEPTLEKNLLDYTRSYEDMLGPKTKQETKDAANEQQLIPKHRTNDPVKRDIDLGEWIKIEKFQINNTDLIEYYYNHTCKFKKESLYSKLVSYDTKHDFTENDSIAFTNWFRFPAIKEEREFVSRNVALVSPQIYTFQFDASVNLFFTEGEWVQITSHENAIPGFEIFGNITNVNGTVLTVAIPQSMTSRANLINSNWMIQTNFSIRKRYMNVFFTNQNGASGLTIDSLGTRGFRVQLNTTSYNFDAALPNPGSEINRKEWYAMVVNISNRFKEVSLTLWKTPTEQKTTKLQRIYTKRFTMQNPHTWSHADVEKYALVANELHQTNIRLMNISITLEEQSKFLTQQYINDSSKAYIVDNAVPPSTAPKLTMR